MAPESCSQTTPKVCPSRRPRTGDGGGSSPGAGDNSLRFTFMAEHLADTDGKFLTPKQII